MRGGSPTSAAGAALTAPDDGRTMRLSVTHSEGIMRAGSVAAAVALAVSLVLFMQLTTSADAPSSVVISVQPCNFGPGPELGIWNASGGINDSGTYVRTEAAVSPPDRPPFSLGPFRETFLLTGSRGTFTISAEERTTEAGQTGVWQISPGGSGGYADTTGHGDVAFLVTPTPNSCPPPINIFTLSLVGVASKGS